MSEGGGSSERPLGLRPLRLALVSVLGAVLAEVALAFSEGLTQAFTVARIPSHLLAILIGGLIGWLIELARQLAFAARGTLDQINTAEERLAVLTSQLEPHAAAAEMLRGCPRHANALRGLIDAATRETVNVIPHVGPADYLRHLRTAITDSDGFQGIQRKPIGWYRDRDAASYLSALSEKRMATKIRLILLDEADVPQMRRDLADPEVMTYFWRHDGSVVNYWTTVANFERNCPGIGVPSDCAIYDSQLLIAYDEARQILTYRLLGEDSDELRIFSTLARLANLNGQGFTLISPPGWLTRLRRTGR